MARIQVNGIELEVVTGGAPDADPMVFIMGIGAQHVMWPDPLLEGVEGRGFRTIRYDNRDSGLSTSLKDAGRPPIFRWMPLALFQRPLPAPYTLWDMADDTAELMAAMGLEKAHVVGVSMGGMIAQCLALRYRERVSSLTLIMTTSGSRRHIIGKPKALAALLGKRPLTAEEAAEHTVDLFRG